MKVFLTGSNGFIGIPTIAELVNRGHHVLALTRSDAGEQKIRALYEFSSKRITIIRGQTEDRELMVATADESDGVIHLAYNADYVGTDRVAAAKQDDAVLEALFAGLRKNGTVKRLVACGGTSGLRPQSQMRAGEATVDALAEDNDMFGKTGARIQSNESVVHAHGVCGIVMRLPPSVHGKGDTQFVSFVREAIVKAGKAAYLGKGTNRWQATHVNDMATALVLALEKGHRGYLHPMAEDGVAFEDIVKALGDRAGLQTESVEQAEFEKIYGWMHSTLTEDRFVDTKRTKEILCWSPQEIGIIEDIHKNY